MSRSLTHCAEGSRRFPAGRYVRLGADRSLVRVLLLPMVPSKNGREVWLGKEPPVPNAGARSRSPEKEGRKGERNKMQELNFNLAFLEEVRLLFNIVKTGKTARNGRLLHRKTAAFVCGRAACVAVALQPVRPRLDGHAGYPGKTDVSMTFGAYAAQSFRGLFGLNYLSMNKNELEAAKKRCKNSTAPIRNRA